MLPDLKKKHLCMAGREASRDSRGLSAFSDLVLHRESLAFKTWPHYKIPAPFPSHPTMTAISVLDMFLVKKKNCWMKASHHLVLLKFILKLMAAGDATYFIEMVRCHWFVKSNVL